MSTDRTATELLLLGAGYSAGYIATATAGQFARVRGTTRSTEQFPRLRSAGIEPVLFDGQTCSDELLDALASATHIVVSIAPDRAPSSSTDSSTESNADPFIRGVGCDQLHSVLHSDAKRAPLWLGYLSTVGVYGDAAGQWVDEQSRCTPGAQRSQQRLRAEQQWSELAQDCAAALAIFRLPGIYGPGRNALVNLHNGKARRIVKKGQVFNRAHVEDIARAVRQAMLSGTAGIYNICDHLPSPPQDVVSYAASLMGIQAPPEIDFNSADLTPMARSFYGENKRVSNAKSLTLVGMSYRYPDYKAGLDALWESGAWSQR